MPPPIAASVEWAAEDRSSKDMYHFLTSAVAPRPIAWVTTLDGDGVVNAAPFSWYQAVCASPPMIMLALGDRPDGSPKDTVANIKATGEFVVNAATKAMLEPMVASSGPYGPGESEVEALGLDTVPSVAVAPPRLAGSPVHLECRLHSTQRLGDQDGTTLILGEVVHVGADDAVLDARGNVDPAVAGLLARLGGSDYLAVEAVFPYKRPMGR